jgi:hypothetical protein
MSLLVCSGHSSTEIWLLFSAGALLLPALCLPFPVGSGRK